MKEQRKVVPKISEFRSFLLGILPKNSLYLLDELVLINCVFKCFINLSRVIKRGVEGAVETL